MPGTLGHDGAFVDPACPVEWAHPLNQGLVLDLTVVPNPGWRGGKTLRDLVRGGRYPHDATLGGSPTWIGGGRPGSAGAVKFASGSSQFGQTPALNLTGVTQLTVAYWMWVDNFGTNADNLAFESSPNFNAAVGGVISDASPSTPTGTITWGISNNGAAYNTVSVPQPSAAAWHHYAVTFDLGKWSSGGLPCAVTGAWIDGVAQTLTGVTVTGSAPADFGNFAWNLMSRNGTGLYLSGRLDGFRVWKNRVFSAAAVGQLYAEDRRGNPGRYRWASTRSYWSTQAAASGFPPPALVARRWEVPTDPMFAE